MKTMQAVLRELATEKLEETQELKRESLRLTRPEA